MTRRTRQAAAVAALLVSSACGGSSTTSPPSAPAPGSTPASTSAAAAPSTKAAALPRPLKTAGSYAYDFPASSPRAPGSFTLIFVDGSRAILRQLVQGQPGTDSTAIAVTGGTITFSGSSGPMCAAADIGRYHFHVQGGALIFRVVREGCAERQHYLTSQPLKYLP